MKALHLVIFAVGIMLFTACSPPSAPLYRDFSIERSDGQLIERMRLAIAEAGWEEAEAPVPHVIRTEPRRIRNWGLYRLVVSLELAPLNDEYVRIYFHPYREYITGGRSKMPFLARTVRSKVLPDLSAALEKQGVRVSDSSVRSQEVTEDS